jgi:hypothetical protein
MFSPLLKSRLSFKPFDIMALDVLAIVILPNGFVVRMRPNVATDAVVN